MLAAMQESFPMFRQYLRTKAKLLGNEKLAWWDLFAPVGKNERKYTWPETVSFITTPVPKLQRPPRQAGAASLRQSLDRRRASHWQTRWSLLHARSRSRRVTHPLQLRRIARPGI